MPNKEQQPLEAFVHRALRELPPERAPVDLEARVFAALAARRRVSPWQAGWRAWPVVPRTAVLAAAAATVFAVVWLSFAGLHAFESFSWSAWIDAHAPGLARLGTVAAALGDALALCFRKFQPWILSAAALAALAYATLLSVGSSLYRRLVATHSTT
ncbi:MAG TPA: hypothetical protein VK178_04330 [Opitutaceae bacterium]|nr:hypothetical protein [Opitutaceae bacterium]